MTSEQMYEFRLADVGEGLHEAEIKRWLVAAGDRVRLDQPLVEIETDKAVVELPSPVAGTVARLGAAEGDILHVGEIVAVLQTESRGGSLVSRAGELDRSTAEHVPMARQASAVPHRTPDATPTSRVLATPAVRRLARELNVDLTQVAGSGPGGRVLAADVESAVGIASRAGPVSEGAAAAESAGTLPSPAAGPRLPAPGERREPLRGLRRRIAQTMTQAWTTIPHITGFDEVEVSALVAARERLRPVAEGRGLRLTYLPFVVKAVSVAVREHPIMNASLDEAAGEIVYHAAAAIGIATATPDGLIVPVLHDAAGMTLLEVQAAIDALSARARARTVTPAELHGGTFTITNFGALGGWQAAPIIRPGEAAILGVGRIQERAWVVNGRIEPRPVLALSLSADHRLIDGDVSTAFLARVGALLSTPDLLLLELR
jgi:pyruvate/2-oxoglutarate dehydrogenase complex dihydrolipoamide acyltransferase (E2) component